ncbi:MAG: LuxR family transcriptional regulator [Paracoccaceae bacterium]
MIYDRAIGTSPPEFEAALLRMGHARDVESLWLIFTEAIAQFDFDRAIYGLTHSRRGDSLGDPRDWVVLCNHPPEFLQEFMEGGLYANAPVLRWALDNRARARSWGDIWHPDNTTDAEKVVIAYNRSKNVTAGYTISFPSTCERRMAAAALTAREGLTQAEVDRNWARFGTQVELACNVMHLKLLTLPHIGRRTLTRRQREVLQWVGDGKTTQDVATLLDVSCATVEKHLRLAREALDVETTAQAVVKAHAGNQMFIVGAGAETGQPDCFCET